IGQFDPGSAGGVGQGWGPGSQDGRANPWDFVFMLEGVLLLAAAAVRRSENSPQEASVPFTVASSSAGFSSSSVQDGSRGETWMPLWSKPASLREIRYLFREGRASIGRSQCRDGLDFARAAASLGVDRGIDGFVRYGFLKRRGKSFAALPCDRVEVAMRPEAALLDPLRKFLKSVRKKNRPASMDEAHMRLSNAVYECTRRPDARHFIAASRALAALDRIPGLPGQALRPCGALSERWIDCCDDGSPEVRLAAAAASLRQDGKLGSFRAHVAPVNPLATSAWDDKSRQYVPWRGSAVDGMGVLLLDRMMRAVQLGADPWKAGIRLHPSDLLPLLEDRVDHFLLADLLRAFSCVRFSRDAMPKRWRSPLQAGALPYGAALLKIFHNSLDGLGQYGLDPSQLRSELRLARLVASGRVEEACRDAARRLRIAGGRKLYLPGSHAEVARGVRRHRSLLACLLVPVDIRLLFKSQPILRSLVQKEDSHDS
ncbi:MAG: type I-U CRISPR-associated protein Csx17, partial [Desulfovibrio sp.]|nr:type I-U CRISPR-associated protein Csx17 [Desulfovibrio sp.]